MEKSINTVSIVGPTASGKTKLSVELAKHFNGEIVSADSMQIYRGMQIATAKPTKEEMDGIPHHMMDFLPPDKTYSVASYVTDASKCIADIHSRGKLPFIVGGTGLYVDSLLNNVSFSDDKRDEEYCLELRKIAEEHGTDRLLEMLAKFDLKSAERLRESISLIKKFAPDYEFRTTYVPALLTEEDLRAIRKELCDDRHWFVQCFKPVNCLNPTFMQMDAVSPEKLQDFLPGIAIRG